MPIIKLKDGDLTYHISHKKRSQNMESFLYRANKILSNVTFLYYLYFKNILSVSANSFSIDSI